MRVLWLPTVLRAAGLTVHEVAGWKTRGADSYGPVRGITCHHTAGSRTSTDAGEINTLVNGRPGLSGPIAQLYLSRSGDWHVVASGHCNHNLVGWAGPNEGYGNDALLGIEAQHAGDGEPWTPRQYDSYVRGVAALVRHEAPGWDVTVARVAGHKEHQPGAKSDPTFNMGAFRTRVAQEIEEWSMALTDEEIERIATRVEARVWNHTEPNPYDNGSTNRRMGGDLRMMEYRDDQRALATNVTRLDGQVIPALARIEARQVAAEGRDYVDEPAITAGILAGITPEMLGAAFVAAGWTPERLAEMIPEELAEGVAQKLSERLAN